MRQRAMLTAVTAAVLFTVLGLITPMAGFTAADVPTEVVDAQVDGLPTATDESGEPVVEDRSGFAATQGHQDDDGHGHGEGWPVGAAGGVRSEAIETPIAYSMVSFAVPEGAGVSFRTRSGDDAWGEWHPVYVQPHEAPDREDDEAREAADAGPHRTFSEPAWVGEADRLQLRVDGADPEDVGVHLIDSLGQNRGAGERISDAVQAVAAAVTGGGQPAAAVVDQPPMISRSEWGADESKRSGSPSYSDGVEAGVLHHTVTGNGYSRSEASAVVRGIYHYHTQTRGWSDIGYNFLIDRFGQIYQGRAGGVEEPVVGAHAAGVNSDTTGVAFMGTHNESGTALASEPENSAVDLLRWLFDVHHIDAEADATVDGRSMPAIIGHGDVGSTSCPGVYVRHRMDAIRSEVVDGQAPMLTAPAESATQLGVQEETRISAGLKPAGEWELTVATEDGRTVHRESGSGESVSVTWAADEAGVYEWELTSPGRRPAGGELGVMDEVAEQVGGHGPLEGSIELSQLAFPDDDTATHAVVARADVFADAMAGGPLAGPDAPLMLTPSHALDREVAAELVRVLPDGETVYVLGGEAAIDQDVVDDLELRWDVQRLAGRERTETAALIAEEVLDRSGADRAMLARSAPDGINPWADALAGSGWGAREGVPVLLTPSHTLTAAPKDTLDRVDETLVLGGTEALTSEVVEQVPNPQRISGGDRASTAVAIAEQLWGRTAGAAGDTFVVGSGWHDGAWQRALASAPLAAQADAPLLLTASDHVSPATADYLDRLGYGSAGVAQGWVLQHSPVIETATWTELNLLMQ